MRASHVCPAFLCFGTVADSFAGPGTRHGAPGRSYDQSQLESELRVQNEDIRTLEENLNRSESKACVGHHVFSMF